METANLEVWVAPFYLKFLHANFLPERSENAEGLHQKALWRQHLRYALQTVTPEIAGDLLGDEHGRARLCGAWFCGLKSWEELVVPLGQQLVRNERAGVTQGLSFALARMPSHASANALCGYLNRVGRAQDSAGQYREEAPWVLAALQWIDAQLHARRADEYIERLTPILQQHAFDAARQRYRQAGARSDNPAAVASWRRGSAAPRPKWNSFFGPTTNPRRPLGFGALCNFARRSSMSRNIRWRASERASTL